MGGYRVFDGDAFRLCFGGDEARFEVEKFDACEPVIDDADGNALGDQGACPNLGARAQSDHGEFLSGCQ